MTEITNLISTTKISYNSNKKYLCQLHGEITEVGILIDTAGNHGGAWCKKCLCTTGGTISPAQEISFTGAIPITEDTPTA